MEPLATALCSGKGFQHNLIERVRLRKSKKRIKCLDNRHVTYTRSLLRSVVVICEMHVYERLGKTSWKSALVE